MRGRKTYRVQGRGMRGRKTYRVPGRGMRGRETARFTAKKIEKIKHRFENKRKTVADPEPDILYLSKHPSPSTARSVKLCSAPLQQYSSRTPCTTTTCQMSGNIKKLVA